MESFETNVEVDAPVERVFEAFRDLDRQARVARESALVQDASVHGDDGSAARVSVDAFGTTWDAEVRVDADPPRTFRYRAEGDWTERGTFRFTPTAGGATRVDYRAEYDVPSDAAEKALSLLGLDARTAKNHLERMKRDVERASEA